MYEEVPRSRVAPGEVLIRIAAVGVNPSDWRTRTGHADIPEDLRPPRHALPLILGHDVSGIIEAVGPEVTAFHEGNAVYGMIHFPGGGGAYAEYVAIDAKDLAPKPVTIDHLQAAAVPTVALTAWQALFVHANLEAGQTILVNGVAGGVGHFAVQLAKAKGARVIGVASGRNAAFLRELGVDHFIDYTATPVEKAAHDVDLVVDTVGGEQGDRLLDVLGRGGKLIAVFLGQYSAEHAAKAGVIAQLFQVRPNAAHLIEIGGLIDAGRVRVAVEAVLPLAQASKAHELSENHHVRGKIVLRVAE
ncbi:NADPH:quinone reductase [Ktedonobacter sp. SOSP1-52]|nr:NADPH:quinone reductase [Ktedonobacter sp. SOSP1-52]